MSHWNMSEPIDLEPAEYVAGEATVLVDCLLILAIFVLTAVSPALIVLAYKAAF